MQKQKCNRFILLGLGFGDEGKGSITDFLVNEFSIDTVVRYNGGSQAAHTVVTPQGITHIFSQFGSGTFIPDTKTYLSEQMFIDPYSLLEEDFVLKQKGIKDGLKRLVLSPNAVVVTPFHKMIGQMEEIARGKQRLATTGKGVGAAALEYLESPKNSIFIKDFLNSKILIKKFENHHKKIFTRAFSILESSNQKDLGKVFLYFKDNYLPNRVIQFYLEFAKSYKDSIDIKNNFRKRLFAANQSYLLEGAQGSLLDPEYGFYPYITKTKTTLSSAFSLIRKKDNITSIGILRCYSHRHGKGPLPTEKKILSKKIKEEHNPENIWQGKFRMGWFDLILARYAVKLNPDLSSIALTCLDQVAEFPKIKVCVEYSYQGKNSNSLKKFFKIKKEKNHIRILDIIRHKHSLEDRKLLTKLLSECKPSCYLEFSTWKKDLDSLRENKIPKELQVFLDFLESKEGIHLPISIVSFGKTRKEKMIR